MECNSAVFWQQLCVERVSYAERSKNDKKRGTRWGVQCPCRVLGGASDPKDSCYDSAAAEWQATAVLPSFKGSKSAVIYFFYLSGLTFEMEDYIIT